MEERKKDHINLALKSQTTENEIDNRFNYEPLLGDHLQSYPKTQFLDAQFKLPIWVSSMTGGTKLAGKINRNLARACNEFGMGMGLGSCRIILNDHTFFEDFNVRDLIGDQPLWANLGIAQIDDVLNNGDISKVDRLVGKLRADGLIIHVNPMQEWFQPEGDIISRSPFEIINEFVAKFKGRVMVKEVGQGMGPKSLEALLKMPIEAIEFAAFGGTNFAKVELLRNADSSMELLEPMSKIGNTAPEMLNWVNEIVSKNQDEVRCKQIIISGGIKNFLDGYYLIEKSIQPAIYGMASAFLKYAREGYDQLQQYIIAQQKGLTAAKNFLTIKA